MKRPSPLLDFIQTQAWAMHEPVLRQLAEIVARHVEGDRVAAETVAAIVEARDAKLDERDQTTQYSVRDGVGIIPIHGVIARYSSQVNGSSQPRGTSVERIRAQLNQALADESVGSILLDINSPGGTVEGGDSLASEIFAAREQKPITAIANGLACSAAYWLGSQASKLYATTDAMVGSIGVYSSVVDASRRAQNAGFDVHVVKAGKFKAGGMPGTRVDAETLAPMQAVVDSYYGLFLEAVARGRGIDAARARELGDGRVHIGKASLELGLVDGIKSYEQLISELSAGDRKVGGENVTARGGNTNAHRAPAAAETSEEPMTKPTETAAAAPAPAVTAETGAQPSPQVAADLRAQGAQAERERISKIRSYASPGQDKLVASLIESGATAHDALEKLHSDLQQTNENRLAAIRGATPKPVGAEEPQPKADEERVTVANKNAKKDGFEPAALVKQFEGDPKLQARFGGSVEHFIAYQRGVQDGSIRPKED